MTDAAAPIHDVIDRWHRFLRGDLPGGLDELLHPDCVFYSPIVYTPQRGRDVTKMYLSAAGATLGGTPKGEGGGGSFGYRTEVVSGHTAVLEFETSVGDTYVNGIDMITCDDDGKIVEFKVMLRPLKAIDLVHQAMRSALESMAPPAG